MIGGSERNVAVERGCANIIAASSSNAFTLCDSVTLTFELLI